MRFIVSMYLLCSLLILTGCETVHEASRATGRVAGDIVTIPGSVTEGAAESVHGGTTPEENPYGR